MRTGTLALAIFALATGASAQTPGRTTGTPGARTDHWELNVHAATLLDNLFENSGGAYQVGARIVRNMAFGLGVGGNFDYVRTSDVLVGPGLSGLRADLYLFSFEIDYAIPVSNQADFFLGAGVGGATVRFSEFAFAPSNFAPSSTGQLIPLAAGFKVRNRADDPSWAFRFDVRDNIIFLNTFDPAEGEQDPEPRNNWELSAGFSFLFGGEPRTVRPEARPEPPVAGRPPAAGPPAARAGQPQPVRDTDGDGIVDGRDRCPNTPPGVRVDAFGCPVRPAAQPPVQPPARPAPRVVDTDLDGVPDVDDRCVNTPRGVRVDARGCPIQPAPAPPRAEPVEREPAPEREPGPQPAAGAPAACVDGRDWYRGQTAIFFAARRWVPLGRPEPITEDNLRRVGGFDGVPIFVGILAAEPYADLWLPRCDPGDTFQLYVEEGIAD
ncbi:MAG TPA: hypothetical protein VM737_04720 [Gemmatimonadota bacterium]|nr:hypothetical protein [Gemmatimonadota bacterium]